MKVSEFQRFVDQHPEYELLFEYVSKSYRMGEHYRFIPKTRWTRTHAQLMANLQFLLASHGAYGSRGFEELDGDILPIVAVAVAKRMKGQKYSKKTPLVDSPSFLSKVKRRFRRGMTQDPQKHQLKKLKRLASAQEESRPQGKPLVLPMQKPKEEKKKTLTYAQVEYYAKQLSLIYARNRKKSRYR